MKDSEGQHHYIPLSWVTKVDSKVHLGRTSDMAMKEWSTSAKPAATGAEATKSKEPAEKPMNDHATNAGIKFAAGSNDNERKLSPVDRLETGADGAKKTAEIHNERDTKPAKGETVPPTRQNKLVNEQPSAL
jgi:hypothetical protein